MTNRKTRTVKKSFWRRLLKKRKTKKKNSMGLIVSPGPKKHKTEPDRWIPPFATKEVPPLKTDSQDLVIVNMPNGFDLGKVAASIGIMVQAELDFSFKLFINECFERFKNLDWGGVNEKEKWVNDQRIMTQTGIVCGVYTELSSGIQIWIVSDLDQGVTKVCLSNEL